MGKRKVGKQFSFTLDRHATITETEGATTLDMYFTRDEALRIMAAVTNTLITRPESKRLHIVGYLIDDGTTHCTVYGL
jgi:hypothetical protein